MSPMLSVEGPPSYPMVYREKDYSISLESLIEQTSPCVHITEIILDELSELS